MALVLQTLLAQSKAVAIDFGPDAKGNPQILNVTYNPEKFTPTTEETFRTASANTPVRSLALLLADMLLTWDFVNPDGSPVEISPDVLNGMGYSVLGKIVESVLKDMNPGE